MTAKGLIIAAPRSGSGKTTITLGLQRALRRRGLIVRGLKCGPDYIDPAFHAAATGAPSANLDSFAMPPALLREIAGEAAEASDLVIAEGSMGLFDGVPGPEGRTGASADIAALLGWPIVLVIDVSGQAQSAAAIALGCMHYDPRINIAGVILNKVASERHSRLVGQGMARIGLPVLGALPREASLILPERHLGLVQAGETEDLQARLEALADAMSAAIDLDAVMAAAGPTGVSAPADAVHPLPAPGRRIAIATRCRLQLRLSACRGRLAGAGRDAGPVLAAGGRAAARGLRCLLAAGRLSRAARGASGRCTALSVGAARFAETRPVHGECGGYMVLGRSLTDAEGVVHGMADLLGVETSFATRKMNLGYRRAVLQADGPLGAPAAG